MNETASRPWIDFQELKGTASVPAVLDALGLLGDLVKVGSDWKGQCPFHKGEGNIKPFSFHEEKRAFHCFACKRKGSILDFVSQYLTWRGEKTGVRQAAEYIVSVMENFIPSPESVKEEEPPPINPKPQDKERTQEAGWHPKGKKKGVEYTAPQAGSDIPTVMSFSVASRLIIGNKINPDDLMVINMNAVGIELVKPYREL